MITLEVTEQQRTVILELSILGRIVDTRVTSEPGFSDSLSGLLSKHSVSYDEIQVTHNHEVTV